MNNDVTANSESEKFPSTVSSSLISNCLGFDYKNDPRSAKIAKDELWGTLSKRLASDLDEQLFSAWIKPLSVEQLEVSSEDSEDSIIKMVLGAPNKFSAEHITRQYSNNISNILSEITGVKNAECSVVISNKNKELSPKASSTGTTVKKKVRRAPRSSRHVSFVASNLNPDYRFSNFVVGACNQFAHAVSERVSKEPGSSYNPLFIYGGVGLGKTHLANAIGNAAKEQNKNVLLVSSESFVNELISALRNNRMQEFKDRFRTLDVLIIDDIQFLIGKERTQEEFFHTFNALHQKRSQIILTSDKLPQELTGIEERLKTRFASGISVDLQTPDYETRVAILTKKSISQNISLPQPVAEFLSDKIDTNVRELEGALNRLHALSLLHDQAITLDLAENCLRSVVPERTREITVEVIQQIVADNFGINRKDLLGKRRTKNIAHPRQVAMYLCRRFTSSSYPEIGALFGGRDHSTVIHAFRVIEKLCTEDSEAKSKIQLIEKKIKG